METSKPNFSIQGRGAALLAAVCLIAPISAGEPVGVSDMADREQAHRTAAAEEAQELLLKGDEAYKAGRYSEAVEAFAGARELLPAAPLTSELRAAATDRYAQASVEYGRSLSRKGDVAGAKAAVDKVLQDDIAPTHAGALAFRAQLDDPIRTNPALTAEHGKDIDNVRRLLYKAEGAYNLGKYDESKATYEKVLRIDPTNSAARRGMEKAANAKSNYSKAGYDETRADMLSQVDAAWETAVPAPDSLSVPGNPGGMNPNAGTISISAKLDKIIIPKIALDQATLGEALDFLRIKSSECDVFENDPARKGVNFTLNIGPPESPGAKRIMAEHINLKLTQVPLSKVLKYLTEITSTSFSTDEFAVVISPAGSTSAELFSRIYHVPPDFITNLSGDGGDSEAKADPFAAADASGKKGILTTRLTAKEVLAKQGVTFPEGATASYTPATNILRVVNTGTNQDIVSQLVEAMAKTEPVAVSIRVTMIKTQQTNLQELGFDWLVTPFALNGGNSIFGSGGTLSNGSKRTGADFVNPVNGVSLSGIPSDPSLAANPGGVTNGLRSGSFAINPDSLDGIVNNFNRNSQQTTVAPGVMAVTGLFSSGQVQAIMRGLDQKKGVDIMARPSVVTRSGQQTSVAVIREFIYPTEYEPPQIPTTVGSIQSGVLGNGPVSSPVTPATPTAFQKKDVGITLEVLPVADPEKRYIDVTLNPQIIDFDGFVNYGTPINTASGGQSILLTQNAILMPVFSAERLNTQLTVADGATIAIGGLMGESIQTVEDKVPVLGDIPIVGRLFTSKVRQPISTAVIFLVHVELLDPTGRPYQDR